MGIEKLLSSLRKYATSVLLKKRLREGRHVVHAQNEHVLFCAGDRKFRWCIFDRDTANLIGGDRVGRLSRVAYFPDSKTFLTEVKEEDLIHTFLLDTGLYDQYGKKLSGENDYPVVVFENRNILFTERTKDVWRILKPDGSLVWEDELFDVCILDSRNVLAYARTGGEDRRAFGILNQEGVWKQRDLASDVHFKQVYALDKFAIELERNENISRLSAYAARKESLCGILNSQGDWIVAPEYLAMQTLPSGKGIFLKKDGLWHCFDENGRQIEGLNYDDIALTSDETFAAKKNAAWSLLSYQHTPRLADTFDSIQASGNNYLVSRGGKYGVIGSDFKWIIAPENHGIWPLYDAFVVQKASDGKKSVIGIDKSMKLDSIIDEFRDHDTGTYFIRLGQTWSVVSLNAIAVRDRFDDVRSSSRRDLFYGRISGIWRICRIVPLESTSGKVEVIDLRQLTATEAQAMEKALPGHCPRIIGEDAGAIDFEDRSLDVLVV